MSVKAVNRGRQALLEGREYKRIRSLLLKSGKSASMVNIARQANAVAFGAGGPDQRVNAARVHRCLGLMTLTRPVRTLVDSGELSISHAESLRGKDVTTQKRLAKAAVKQKLTIDQMLERDGASKGHSSRSAPRASEDADTARLEEALAEYLGVPVSISPRTGSLTIAYQTPDILAGVLDRIAFSYEG